MGWIESFTLLSEHLSILHNISCYIPILVLSSSLFLSLKHLAKCWMLLFALPRKNNSESVDWETCFEICWLRIMCAGIWIWVVLNDMYQPLRLDWKCYVSVHCFSNGIYRWGYNLFNWRYIYIYIHWLFQSRHNLRQWSVSLLYNSKVYTRQSHHSMQQMRFENHRLCKIVFCSPCIPVIGISCIFLLKDYAISGALKSVNRTPWDRLSAETLCQINLWREWSCFWTAPSPQSELNKLCTGLSDFHVELLECVALILTCARLGYRSVSTNQSPVQIIACVVDTSRLEQFFSTNAHQSIELSWSIPLGPECR